MSVRDSINIGRGRPHYIRNRCAIMAHFRISNAEDAYVAVAYIPAIFLPDLPVPCPPVRFLSPRFLSRFMRR